MPVSDDDLRSKLRDMLPSVDLQTETERSLREKLQEHFECNLKDRKQVFKACGTLCPRSQRECVKGNEHVTVMINCSYFSTGPLRLKPFLHAKAGPL